MRRITCLSSAVLTIMLVGCQDGPTTPREEAEAAQENLAEAREEAADIVADAEEDAIDTVADAKAEAREEIQQAENRATEMVQDAKVDLEQKMKQLGDTQELIEPRNHQDVDPDVEDSDTVIIQTEEP